MYPYICVVILGMGVKSFATCNKKVNKICKESFPVIDPLIDR